MDDIDVDEALERGTPRAVPPPTRSCSHASHPDGTHRRWEHVRTR